jgi:protease IV
VVAGKLVTTEMWRKVGITFKDYKRGQNAGLLSGSEMWTDAERQRMRAWMDEVYQTFQRHVTAARGDRLKKPLEELAGGRVFTGRQALELGLIDKIGTLDDAITFVAAKAKLEDGTYEVRTIPAPKNLIELLMAATGQDDGEPGSVSSAPRPRFAPPGGASLADLATPYLRQLDPQRVAAVKSALVRLELLRREGVILAMPEIVIPQ